MFTVFIAIMFVVLKVQMLGIFESLMHCLFCLHTSSFFFPSSIIWLLSSDIFLLHILPFCSVTVLIVFIADAKSLLYLYFDIFIILFNFGLWSWNVPFMVLKCMKISSSDHIFVHKNTYFAIRVIWDQVMKMFTILHSFVNLLVMLLSFFSCILFASFSAPGL